MPLIYVTGICGAGKSTVCDELQRRGYDAHDTDEEGNAAFFEVLSGEFVPPRPLRERTPSTRELLEWRMIGPRIEQLARTADDHVVFLCGTTSNERSFWHLFSTVVYLSIDETTLRDRLASRSNNDFGKVPHELQLCLNWLEVADDEYASYGAIKVDARKPLAGVVDAVVAIGHSTSSSRGEGDRFRRYGPR